MAEGGATFAATPVMGNQSVTDAPWGHVVDIGTLAFGQSRELVVCMQNMPTRGEYLEV